MVPPLSVVKTGNEKPKLKNLEGEGIMTLTLDEILVLRGKSPKMIKKIHEAKKVFPGAKLLEKEK